MRGAKGTLMLPARAARRFCIRCVCQKPDEPGKCQRRLPPHAPSRAINAPKAAPGGSFARGSNETNFVNSYSKRWQAGPYQNTLKGMAPNMMIDQSRGPAEFRPLSQSGVPLDGQRPVKRYGAAKFWDRIAKRYARSPVADEASYQKKLERAGSGKLNTRVKWIFSLLTAL